jgi:hypothetical protein
MKKWLLPPRRGGYPPSRYPLPLIFVTAVTFLVNWVISFVVAVIFLVRALIFFMHCAIFLVIGVVF